MQQERSGHRPPKGLPLLRHGHDGLAHPLFSLALSPALYNPARPIRGTPLPFGCIGRNQRHETSVSPATRPEPRKPPHVRSRIYNSSRFMPDADALDEHYKARTDEELLKLRAEGGFTAEAEQVLDNELARRKLTPGEAKRRFAPEWLDKADLGAVGVFPLEGGERMTAEVLGLNETGDRLSVKVIFPDSPPRGRRRKRLAIPLHRIVSFKPEPNLMDKWPYCGPCRDFSISYPRSYLLTIIFLSMTIGSVPLFLLSVNRPFGLQEASIITYTLFEVFFTFAHHGGGPSGPNVPPFKFSCPAVEPQIPRLLWRHLGFLIALVVLQTEMLATRPHWPSWWLMTDRKGTTPFDAAFVLLCFALAWTQIITNRALLKRAHGEFSPQNGG